MTLPRLRQLVFASQTLETADQLRTLLGLGEPFDDPGVREFDLVNAVFALGDQFLEVVVPQAPTAPAQRFLNRSGDGGYMAIFQTDDLAATRARCDAAGMRRVWNVDREDILASHIHPADIGAAIVSIDEPHPAASWRWGGPGWEARATAGQLTGAKIEGPDPDALQAKWATALGLKPEGHELVLADARLVFESAESERLVAFDIALPDVDAALARAADLGLPIQGRTVQLGGVDLNLS